jgi:hypothetical protein
MSVQNSKLVQLTLNVTRGRCYDHNFQRFLPIFGENIAIFLENQRDYHFLPELAVLCLKTLIFRQFFGENILKIITSVPDSRIQTLKE